MGYPKALKTPVDHAKRIIEVNPNRVFFLIADDSAFLQTFGADILSPTGSSNVTQPVVVIDLNDPAWKPALVSQRLIDIIDNKIYEGKSFAMVGTSEHAKTYSIPSAITIWL